MTETREVIICDLLWRRKKVVVYICNDTAFVDNFRLAKTALDDLIIIIAVAYIMMICFVGDYSSWSSNAGITRIWNCGIEQVNISYMLHLCLR